MTIGIGAWKHRLHNILLDNGLTCMMKKSLLRLLDKWLYDMGVQHLYFIINNLKYTRSP